MAKAWLTLTALQPLASSFVPLLRVFPRSIFGDQYTQIVAALRALRRLGHVNEGRSSDAEDFSCHTISSRGILNTHQAALEQLSQIFTLALVTSLLTVFCDAAAPNIS